MLVKLSPCWVIMYLANADRLAESRWSCTKITHTMLANLLAGFFNYVQPFAKRAGEWFLGISSLRGFVGIFGAFSAGFFGGLGLTVMTDPNALSFLDKMWLIAEWSLPGLAFGFAVYLLTQLVGHFFCT